MVKDLLGRKVSLREEKDRFGDKFRFYLKAGWTFDRWYEKIILSFLIIYAIYSLIRNFIN